MPVMLDRCVELLEPALQSSGAVLVDATLGLAGHSRALLERCPGARLLGIDRDPQALAIAGQVLAPFGERVRLEHAVHEDIPELLRAADLGPADAVLMDLGVSSLQLDESDRGFAYSIDSPLDMRMDPAGDLTAAEVLNTYPAGDLLRILREYGEERFARRIVDAVLRERVREPFETSARLVRLLQDAIPAPARRTGGHPAKRTFQALRIEVNRELAVLRQAVPAAVSALGQGGRIVVLAYHSLEDRIVKQTLTSGAKGSTPPGLPVELPEHAPQLRLLTRGAERPGPEELDRNPRSASARLRAAERIRPAPEDRAGAAARNGRTVRTTGVPSHGPLGGDAR
ncbi:MAG: rRNA (cytosine1402-N4)-methyltransferase [Actinomycetota bacterium]|nr:rRNA (cytosine1402-N4)-methyltransferase [Actinomycetota bacterium]